MSETPRRQIPTLPEASELEPDDRLLLRQGIEDRQLPASIILNGIEDSIGAVIVDGDDPGSVGQFRLWMDTSGANPRLRQRNAANNGWVDVAEHEDGEWRPFISGEAQQVGTQSDHDEAAATLVRGDRLAASAGFPFANMPLVGGAPIVENGSNSDGRWTKYADGTQIVTTVNVSIDRSSDSSFDISNIIELPVAFSNSEYFAVGMRQTSSGRASPRPEYVIANKTTDTVDVRAAREDTTGQSTVSFAAMCVGDWE